MTTAAKPTSEQGSHYYKPDGSPAYEVVGANGAMRKTTISDARKLGLYPSVTTVITVLNRPGLNAWKTESSCLAVLTTPRLPGELLDSFVDRVLHRERVQEQEADAAKQLGTNIHDTLQSALEMKDVKNSPHWEWCEPAYREISQRGTVVAVEKCIVGEGYAGRVDLIQDQNGQLVIWDWKTTKKLPKSGAYKEHAIQLSAYAAALAKTTAQPIRTGNVYISTIEKGAFQICEHGDWRATYEQAFLPLFKVWQFVNSFNPLMHLN